MSWQKSVCADCPHSPTCPAKVKFYTHYCGSRKKQLANEIAVNESLCRKMNWLKTKPPLAA